MDAPLLLKCQKQQILIILNEYWVIKLCLIAESVYNKCRSYLSIKEVLDKLLDLQDPSGATDENNFIDLILLQISIL